MARDRLLIRDGHVLTLDPSLGDFERADILVEDGRIAAVEPDLAAGDCEVLDAAGKIVMPGFVDTHRHTWQTAMRGICADWTLLDYFRGIRLNISTELGPEDMYAGNYVGALEALDAGVTSDARLLALHQHPRARRRGDSRARGGRAAGGVRLRLLPGAAGASPSSTVTTPGWRTRGACARERFAAERRARSRWGSR